MSQSTIYISNTDHYSMVLDKVRSVKKSLWIGMADIKDLYTKQGAASVPYFREDFDRYPILSKGLERILCPRVHFKMMIFDFEYVYIGSANLTGAGMGMKGEQL